MAELYDRVMTKGMKFVEEGLEKAERRYQEQHSKLLNRLAAKMGYRLVPEDQTAGSLILNGFRESSLVGSLDGMPEGCRRRRSATPPYSGFKSFLRCARLVRL